MVPSAMTGHSNPTKSALASIEEADEHAQKKSNETSQQILAVETKSVIPLWHTLKLCIIGKASAGKRTVAS